jgi:hypothetical protein
LESGIDLRDALIDWDDPDEDSGNTSNIAEQGLTPEEVESVLYDPSSTFDFSASSGQPVAFGYTSTGRFIVVAFDVLNPDDPLIIHPVTAYEDPEPGV